MIPTKLHYFLLYQRRTAVGLELELFFNPETVLTHTHVIAIVTNLNDQALSNKKCCIDFETITISRILSAISGNNGENEELQTKFLCHLMQ